MTEAFLDRAEALNPRVNAFITVTARARARGGARRRRRKSLPVKYRGPLHGLPYAPKDILATKGIKTTNGSKVTPTRCPITSRRSPSACNDAGAILIGKLNLLEFAMGSGVLSGFGPARNPWHLDYSPAGSSSGSGAALAAYMTPLSIGTDTGGSIRGPANNCGIVGFKQTYGRVSRYGVTTLSWTLDHAGPMTKTVADAAAILQVIAGADPNDADQRPRAGAGLREVAHRQDVKGLRVGVPTNYFFEDVNPETDKAVRAAVALLKEMGATIVEVEGAARQSGELRRLDHRHGGGRRFHEQRLKDKPELFDPIVRERLEAARFYPATDYVKSMRIRSILIDEMRQVFATCDVMAVPGGNPATKLDPPEICEERRAARVQVATAVPRRQHVHRRHDGPAGDDDPVWLYQRRRRRCRCRSSSTASRTTRRRCCA